jgi:hypothetical protein
MTNRTFTTRAFTIVNGTLGGIGGTTALIAVAGELTLLVVAEVEALGDPGKDLTCPFGTIFIPPPPMTTGAWPLAIPAIGKGDMGLFAKVGYASGRIGEACTDGGYKREGS